MATERKVVIIGAGCAGLTAALYTARNALEPLILEGASPGGQLMITTEVENYPGFVEGIMGPQLIQTMRDQAERFGAEFIQKDADSLDLSERPFTITAGGETYEAQALIVATGARPNLLGLEAEQRLMGHVRWPVLPRQVSPGHRRRRQRDGGSYLPDPLRRPGHYRSPPRRTARLENHAGARDE